MEISFTEQVVMGWKPIVIFRLSRPSAGFLDALVRLRAGEVSLLSPELRSPAAPHGQ